MCWFSGVVKASSNSQRQPYTDMSTRQKQTTPTDRPEATDAPTDRIDVSDHAARRYLERVDAADLYPEDRIRREFAEALSDTVTTDTRGIWYVTHEERGAVFLFDPGTRVIISVLLPTGGDR